jgi:hypothetical protein
MKTKILIFALMAFSTLGLSQEIKTVFSNGDSNTKTIGGFGGPLFQVSNINNDWGIIIGGQGGVVINRRFAFGGIGKSLVNNSTFVGDDLNGNNSASLSMNYGGGGLFFEYLFKLESPIHFSIPVNFMAGKISIEDVTSDASEIESSGFFVLEPGINLEFNVSKSFIPALNISYRQVFGSSLINLSDQDISGVNIGLIFKFGNF